VSDNVSSDSVSSEVERLRAELAAAQAQAANLETALHTSRRIGAAIGILMSQYGLQDEEAFDLLRVVSQDTNRKISDLAEDVLHTGGLDYVSRARDRRGRARLRVVN
jgi:AmiR/NasT family two-component response regulator